MAWREKRTHLLVGKWEIVRTECRYEGDADDAWKVFYTFEPGEAIFVFKDYDYIFNYTVGCKIYKTPYIFYPEMLVLCVDCIYKMLSDKLWTDNFDEYNVEVVSADEIYLNMTFNESIPVPSNTFRLNLRRLPADTVVLSKRWWKVSCEYDAEGRIISKRLVPPAPKIRCKSVNDYGVDVQWLG